MASGTMLFMFKGAPKAPEGTAPPMAEPPALPPKVRERLVQAETVLRIGNRLLASLRPRMAVLQAAGEQAGFLRAGKAPVGPGQRKPVADVRDLLARQPAAARQIASAVQQYADATSALRDLEGALATGRFEDIRIERISGQLFNLNVLSHSFAAYPLLRQLFDPQGRPAGTGGVSGLPGRKPPASEGVKARRLALRLQIQMAILHAALERIGPEGGTTGSLLPQLARQTAQALARTLQPGSRWLELVREATASYREVCLAQEPGATADPGRLGRAVQLLEALPTRARGHEILTRLFPEPFPVRGVQHRPAADLLPPGIPGWRHSSPAPARSGALGLPAKPAQGSPCPVSP